MTRKVIITGGSSGIGLETARKFLANGDEVIICGRNSTRLDEAAARLDDVVAVPLDVADQNAVNTFFEETGPFDILVANAGVCLQARLDDPHSDQVWSQTIETNLNGVYYCLRAATSTLRNGGSIITVSSGLGKNARAGYEAYTASKHAVLGLTKCVALELAPGLSASTPSVRVGWTLQCPGPIPPKAPAKPDSPSKSTATPPSPAFPSVEWSTPMKSPA